MHIFIFVSFYILCSTCIVLLIAHRAFLIAAVVVIILFVIGFFVTFNINSNTSIPGWTQSESLVQWGATSAEREVTLADLSGEDSVPVALSEPCIRYVVVESPDYSIRIGATIPEITIPV
jgi:hypothetical protein